MQVKLKPQLHASWIDPYAREIVENLQKRGFTSYLVGGCVRDLLVGIHPKDYDIATNASPNEVKRTIPQSYIIGKRFRLVLVKRRQHQFEVATFRRESKPEDFQDVPEGAATPSGDNFFGTPEEDALRRDFTVNALFYDPVSDQLIDFANALEDIKLRTLRMIGDPDKRIVEDPIRILRAQRLAQKVEFTLEPSLRDSMSRMAGELARAVLPRRREEYIKIMRLDEPTRAWAELWDLGILSVVIPALDPVFQDKERTEIFMHWIRRRDELCADLAVPTELFAPLVWAYAQAMEGAPDLEQQLDNFMKRDLGLFKAEQAEIMAAIELIPRLKEIDAIQRRGARRQQGFMGLPQLPMALRFASADYRLSLEELDFWQKAWHTNALPEPEPRVSASQQRRSRGGRGRRGGRSGEGRGRDSGGERGSRNEGDESLADSEDAGGSTASPTDSAPNPGH